MSAPSPSLDERALRLAEGIRGARSLTDAASLALVALREVEAAERERVLDLGAQLAREGR